MQTKHRASIIKWLLDSDPAIRWQVMRDLTHEPPEVIASERTRVATHGWGAQLLALQAPDGTWLAESDRWPLKGTIEALVLLKELGLKPSSTEARLATERVRENLIWHWHDSRPFFDGETEACINGRILAVGSYFGEASERLVDLLLSEQLPDGGWNCEAPKSQRSSFHSTICVLEGLLEYERAKVHSPAVTEARHRAHEYLLERRMFRSLSTGEVIEKQWTRFNFPTTYRYDVLRGLDYLRSAGVTPDERVREAVELVAARAHQNGRWPLRKHHEDVIAVQTETEVGHASRWITLRALRVLDWGRAS